VVLALTGYGSERDRQSSLAAGFDGHLVKPVDVAAIDPLLLELLETRRSPQREE
jgi:CheY-like chemotaxis protein